MPPRTTKNSNKNDTAPTTATSPIPAQTQNQQQPVNAPETRTSRSAGKQDQPADDGVPNPTTPHPSMTTESHSGPTTRSYEENKKKIAEARKDVYERLRELCSLVGVMPPEKGSKGLFSTSRNSIADLFKPEVQHKT